MYNAYIRPIAAALALLIIAALPALSSADEKSFREPINELASYFKPVLGNIASAEGEALVMDIGSEAGLKVGMRLRVLRLGEPFVHPITGEQVGRTETQVGLAEVTSVGADWGRLKLLLGGAQKGDIARIGSTRIKALFYQSKSVDWDVSEEYYYWLKDQSRFEIMDAPPGAPNDLAVVKEAKALGAELAIIISPSSNPADLGRLRQRAYWAMDGVLLMTTEAALPEQELTKIKGTMSLKSVEPSGEVYAITLPEQAWLMLAADLNGDAEPELITTFASAMKVYELGPILKPAFGLEVPITHSFATGERPVRLEYEDMDKDGRHEFLVVTVLDNKAASYLMRFDTKANRFEVLWKRELFARMLGGKLMAQRQGVGGGYTGPVFPLGLNGEPISGTPALELPAQVNIYDFVQRGDGFIVMRTGGDLEYLDAKGITLWRSPEHFGGALRKYEVTERMADDDERTWAVADRFIESGERLVLIQRELESLYMKGLGFKGSKVVMLGSGKTPSLTRLIDGIPDTAYDIALVGSRLIVLTDSYEADALNFIKGKRLFKSKVLVYNLRDQEQ